MINCQRRAQHFDRHAFVHQGMLAAIDGTHAAGFD
jgi:hypothetical protein